MRYFKKELIVEVCNKNIHINDLKEGSHENVMVKCEICGKIFKRQLRVLTQKEIYRCGSCSRKEAFNKDEYRKKVSKRMQGHKHNNFPYEYHKKFVEDKNYILLTTKEQYYSKDFKTTEMRCICPIHNYEFRYVGNRTSCILCSKEKKKLPPELIGNFKYYKERVKFFTEFCYRKYFYLINPDIKPRNKSYPLDHKFSVKMGFENNIPPYIIGSPINLYIGLTKSANSEKSFYCSISIEELYNEYFKLNENETGGIYPTSLIF